MEKSYRVGLLRGTLSAAFQQKEKLEEGKQLLIKVDASDAETIGRYRGSHREGMSYSFIDNEKPILAQIKKAKAIADSFISEMMAAG